MKERINYGNGTEQRKDTLKHIKEYVLGLLKRKQKMEQERVKDVTKEDLDETLTSDSKEDLEEKTQKSWLDKIKDKLGFEDEDENGESDDLTEGKNKNNNQSGEISKGGFEIPAEDQDEYIPQDSEIGEAMGESPRFAEIYPPFKGYFTQGKKSYFDPTTNLWSKKKQLSDLDNQLGNNIKKYQYAGKMRKGLMAIPLPQSALPDTDSLCFNGKIAPSFKIDQNNCIYLYSNEEQFISFDFGLNQIKNNNLPIVEDIENIIFSDLKQETQDLLDNLQGKSEMEKAQGIKNYIISTKKYNTTKQGTLRNKSNSKNYINNLDNSAILECYSANSLFVALCRKLGISARLIVGHMIQSVAKDGKTHLNSNNGHAWSEIWDEKTMEWLRFDATPIEKEEKSDDDQNKNESEENEQNQDAENNMGEDNNDSCDNDGNDRGGGGDQEGGDGQEGGQSDKSAEQMLDELIEKAKEDSLTKQAEEIKDTIEKLEQAKSKEDIREILDEAGLDDFAKDIVDKVGNDGILEEEKKEIESIENNDELDKALEDSLLDDEYKKKLKKYADIIKKKIEEQKKRMKSEMERYGFSENEMNLYKQYKKLEKEVEPQVRQQISELQKLLPPKWQILKDTKNYYRSGARLDRTKLVDWKVSGDNKIFQRSRREMDTREINMFETILIDRSGSMGDFDSQGSPIREAVKTAIIRAKVLEHFKVNFSIQFFDDNTEEIMSFGEKFSDRKKNMIPSKLMKAVQKSGGTNIGEPLSYTYASMKDYARENGNQSFGNITFLGDGSPNGGLRGQELTNLINQIRKDGFGLTAYYIDGSGQNMSELQQYFGSTDSGGTIVVPDIDKLTEQVIGSYNKSLKQIVARYTK